MPAPSRDRLPRPIDISTLFRGAARRVDLIVDEPGLRWSGLSGNPTRSGSVSGGSGSNVTRIGVHRVGLGYHRNFHRSPAVVRENRPTVTPARRGGRRSVLPNWYPRTPLREITAIVGAIERRRAELQVDEVTEPSLENTTNAPSSAGAQPEHLEVGSSTPLPTILMKPQPSPVTQAVKITGGITLKENRPDWDFLTPEKKLLNSIEQVSEVWVKEQRKLERTPASKKAERERKVRVLMSMR